MNIIVNGGSSKAGRLSWMQSFNLMNVAVPFTPSHDTKVWNLVFKKWFESFYFMPNLKLKCCNSGVVLKNLDSVTYLRRYLSKLFLRSNINEVWCVVSQKHKMTQLCARSASWLDHLLGSRATLSHLLSRAQAQDWTSIDPHRFFAIITMINLNIYCFILINPSSKNQHFFKHFTNNEIIYT